MKSRSIRYLPLLLMLLLLTACSRHANMPGDSFATSYPSQFIVGDVYILKGFEKIEGNIVGIDTSLFIEEGAAVLGDVHLVGSELEVGGRIAGEINMFGGESHFLKSAVVSGSINKFGNVMEINPGAVIYGEINTFTVPEQGQENQIEDIQLPLKIESLVGPRALIIFQLFINLLLLLINILIVFLFGPQTIQITKKLAEDPLVSWLIGLLVFIAVPVISIVLIISICLSPIGLILLIVLGLINLWGWGVTSYFTGAKLSKWFKIRTSDIGIVTIGSIFFGILFILAAFVPIVNIILSMIISTFGSGSIILRFLTK